MWFLSVSESPFRHLGRKPYHAFTKGDVWSLYETGKLKFYQHYDMQFLYSIQIQPDILFSTSDIHGIYMMYMYV